MHLVDEYSHPFPLFGSLSGKFVGVVVGHDSIWMRLFLKEIYPTQEYFGGILFHVQLVLSRGGIRICMMDWFLGV